MWHGWVLAPSCLLLFQCFLLCLISSKSLMSSHDLGATNATKSKKGKERRSSASFLTAILSFYSLPCQLILSPNKVILFEKQWNKYYRKQCKKSYSYRKFTRRHKVFSTLRLFLNVRLLMTFMNMFLIEPQRPFHTANQIVQTCPAVTVHWERGGHRLPRAEKQRLIWTGCSLPNHETLVWCMSEICLESLNFKDALGQQAKRKGYERNS